VLTEFLVSLKVKAVEEVRRENSVVKFPVLMPKLSQQNFVLIE